MPSLDRTTGLVGLDCQRFNDCDVPMEYNEIVIIVKDSRQKLIGRIQKEWFEIGMPYKKGKKIPYSNHLKDGKFKIKLNNKSAIYSVMENRVIHQNLDSVYLMERTWQYGDQATIGIEKNGILYTPDLDDSLYYHYKNIYFTSLYTKDSKQKYGLGLIRLDGDSVQLLPSTFDDFKFQGLPVYLRATRNDSLFYFGRNIHKPLINKKNPYGPLYSFISSDNKRLIFDKQFNLIQTDTGIFMHYDALPNYLYTMEKDNMRYYYDKHNNELFQQSLVGLTMDKGSSTIGDSITLLSFEGSKGPTGYLVNTKRSTVIKSDDFQHLIFSENPIAPNTLVVKKNNLYAVIDINENNIVPYLYDSISTYIANTQSYKNYLSGKFIIKKNGKYGLMDAYYKIAIDPQFDSIDAFISYYAVDKPPIIVCTKAGKKSIYDINTLEKKKFTGDSVSMKLIKNKTETLLYKNGKVYKLDPQGNIVK